MNVSVINDETIHSDEFDPAASSTSTSSPLPDRLSDSSTLTGATAHIGDVQVVTDTPRSTATASSSAAAAAVEDEDSQLEQFRSIIDPDGEMPIELLREIYEENRRASANRVTSTASAAAGGDSQRTLSSTAPPAPPLQRDSSTVNRWEQCRPASSRPGVVSVGGQRTGQIYPVGQMDEIELIEKKINAVHKIQETLNKRLSYNLQSRKLEVERIHEEEQRMLESTRLDQITKSMLVPKVKTWDAPSDDLLRKEPTLPSPIQPLPHPSSQFCIEEGLENHEIALGKLVDPGEGEEDDNDEEEKQEEDASIENRWAGISLDDATLGAYDHVVRCWKCRAGLKINMEIGLVVCPRCRSISPTTDVANIG
jgi:hypothetical protein